MGENAAIVEAWNTVLFDKFVRFRHLVVAGLSGHSDELLGRKPFAAGEHVLDIGCGFGDSTRQIAQLVGSSGRAVGVDCAENFLHLARAEAREANIANADFFCADVQSDDLRGPYDHAFARFGTMFFNTPGAALRNVARSLKPGGTLTQIVWRKREENRWVHQAELKVREIVPVVQHEQTNQVHCGPGPFSMAGPDLVSALLKSAGFDQIRFERFDTDICIGRSLDEAVEFAMTLGPAGEIMRLAGDDGVRLRPKVVAGLRETLSEFVKDNGVWGPSSTWFVTARKIRS